MWIKVEIGQNYLNSRLEVNEIHVAISYMQGYNERKFFKANIGVSVDNRGKPRITALICTLNEAENLAHVLPHIPQWVDEIIMIDGHSTDRTVEIARQLRPEIKALFQPGKGKGDALNPDFPYQTGA